MVLVGGLTLAALTACSFSVRGLPSPGAAAATSSAPAPSSAAHTGLPGGASRSCLVADGCGDEETTAAAPAHLVCTPLSAARSSFDAVAGARFPGGSVPRTGGDAVWSAIGDLVGQVVDQCGFGVMVVVADRYPDPLYTWLLDEAVFQLGEISALPEGLRCAELQTLGLGPKQAVDYWFFWGMPPLMDADSNGIPCETVWPDVAQYVPAGF
jgi:hypothetical protein